jgi:hypothetical protein
MRPGGEQETIGARTARELDARADALRALVDGAVPFVVGGAYAYFEYTGIYRDTKDLDVFLRRRDLERAFVALEVSGFRAEQVDPVWIGKAWRGEWFVDLIFSSGNGVAVVDDRWFEHARDAVVMGVEVRIAPPEEMIWSKAFVCERERYDGHDVANLVRACGEHLDWQRLLDRFAEHWEVLFSHLVMYRFAFPAERTRVPEWVMRELLARSAAQVDAGDSERRVCRGPIVAKGQYGPLLDALGYPEVRPALPDAAPPGGDGDGELSPGRGR